jgi:hypothetical protein
MLVLAAKLKTKRAAANLLLLELKSDPVSFADFADQRRSWFDALLRKLHCDQAIACRANAAFLSGLRIGQPRVTRPGTFANAWRSKTKAVPIAEGG